MVKSELVFPDTYNKNFVCGNCDSSVGLSIPLGITILEYAKEHKCLNCGCMLLPKEGQQYTQPDITPMIYLPYYGLRR